MDLLRHCWCQLSASADSFTSGRLKLRMPFYDFGFDRHLQVSVCLNVAELRAVRRACACGHTFISLCSLCLMTH